MFVAIVSWTDDNSLAKYRNFDVEADANAHVAKYGGFVVENPSGGQNYWVINSTKKTVTFDKDQSDKDKLSRAWSDLRTTRDAKLSKSDWMSFGDSPDMSDAWTAYRKKLRDLPGTLNDTKVVKTITWPTEP